ncbi:MAG TPA: hypothetical protein VK809_12685, partial [Bacteroidia bacterium]|nr:hypothetical protein [Bacteroidia bacterium]
MRHTLKDTIEDWYKLDLTKINGKLFMLAYTIDGEYPAEQTVFLKGKSMFENFRSLAEMYCKEKKLNLDTAIQAHEPIFIISTDMVYFTSMLAFALVYWDEFEIPQLLDYHKENYYPYDDFVERVDKFVYHSMVGSSPILNRRRRAAIKAWVAKQRKASKVIHPLVAPPEGTQIEVKVVSKSTGKKPYISWDTQLRKRSKLAKELYRSDFISKAKDFESVFTEHIVCTWNRDAGGLAYLIQYLHENNFIEVRGERKDAYFK